MVSVLGKASEVVVENELCDEYRYKVRAEIGHGTNQHGAERYPPLIKEGKELCGGSQPHKRIEPFVGQFLRVGVGMFDVFPAKTGRK